MNGKKHTSDLLISDLHVSTGEGKEILHGVDLQIRRGEVHALMGPNGGGKSTLAATLAGHPGYVVRKGRIVLDGRDFTREPADKRAAAGLFLGFQYPAEVAGVNFASFLRMAYNQNRPKKDKASPIAFRGILAEAAGVLGMDDLTKRSLNEGFSGGEKKKSEVLQMLVLKPKYAVLDEPDSGLDVDALKIIARAISVMEKKPGMLLVTHYQRILHYIKPDRVHILAGGRIVRSGPASLAREIEKEGYEKYQGKV